MNPNITAQVQQFHRRQEQLTASTHRRFQQQAEMGRRHTEADNLLGSLHQSSTGLDDPYHRASLPINFESSVNPDSNSRQPEHHINLQQPSYRETRPHEQMQTPQYNYSHDLAQSLAHIPYAVTLSAQIFRPPSVTEMDTRRQVHHHMLQAREIPADSDKNNAYVVTVNDTTEPELTNSSQSSLSLESEDSDTSPYDELHENPFDGKPEYTTQQPPPPLQHDTTQPSDDPLKSKSLTVEEDPVPEAFPGLERMFETWDATDNEWLYSLQTECARPGAVCECGESCCCPGCFTHTNNPGDRGVYNTMLNKLGSILETDTVEEETQTEISKPCHSSSGGGRVERSPDAKL
jgi:hypothetical protein